MKLEVWNRAGLLGPPHAVPSRQPSLRLAHFYVPLVVLLTGFRSKNSPGGRDNSWDATLVCVYPILDLTREMKVFLLKPRNYFRPNSIHLFGPRMAKMYSLFQTRTYRFVGASLNMEYLFVLLIIYSGLCCIDPLFHRLRPAIS